MVLWGGLRPIVSQIAIDVFSLLGLSYATLTKTDRPSNSLALVAACSLTIVTAGISNRWTITLPMVPIVILQAFRRVIVKVTRSTETSSVQRLSRWLPAMVTLGSMLIIIGSASLTILFPAVELPPVSGPYRVGVADFFLSVDLELPDTCTIHGNESEQHVSVKILYPTLEETSIVPYLHPDSAIEFCRHTMRFGAPPPLKEFGWLLHTWRLTGLRARRNAKPLPASEIDSFPLVSFSHGLGGTADIYSYQTMALAARGYVVLLVNHNDGSAPVVRHVNGSLSSFDYKIGKLAAEGNHTEYVRLRRQKTDHRVEELISATEAFLALNEDDIPELSQAGVSFRNRLKNVTFMGHSFGGATALTAAKRRPDLASAVIAHEPAVNWMPDDARRSLFSTSGVGYDAFGLDNGDEEDIDTSIHDVDMLILFSHEWREKKWGFSDILEDMHRTGKLGTPKSELFVIEAAHHSEFSDTCMLTPVWLARSTNLTGSRNPVETAKEIEEKSFAFLQKVHSQR